MELLLDRIAAAENRAQQLRQNAAPTVPEYDLQGGITENVFRFDETADFSDGRATKSLPGLTPPFYSQFDFYAPSASETILQDNSIQTGPTFLTILGNWDDLVRFWDSGASNRTVPYPGLSSASIASLPNLPLDIWSTITFTVDLSVVITWKLNGVTIDSYTTVFDPPNNNWLWGSGIFPALSLGAFYYLKNIKVGTTLGASDIFAPVVVSDFDSHGIDFVDSTGP